VLNGRSRFIDRNGRVTGKSALPQNEVLASALRTPFLPALLNGQPVESKGSFARRVLR
jgi:hypothetical protein